MNAEEIAQRIGALAAADTLRAERDQARRQVQTIETQLRIVTNERDEARALGRVA